LSRLEIARARIFVLAIIHSLAVPQMRFSPRALFLLLAIPLTCGPTDVARTRATGSESRLPRAIVIGFVGGFIRHDNRIHGGVQIADRLRKDYPSGVYIEVFENHRGEQAHQLILRLLDTDHDGSLSAEEKRMPTSSFTGIAGVVRRRLR
jgi:hypothetical protein